MKTCYGKQKVRVRISKPDSFAKLVSFSTGVPSSLAEPGPGTLKPL